MIKPCSVIYFPGTGGNFIKYCLSLSKETVPYLTTDLSTLDVCDIDQLSSLTATQRKDYIQYQTFTDFNRLHFRSKNLFEPAFNYSNEKLCQMYSWSIVHNHPDNYHSRLPWLKNIIFLELDYEKYGPWVQKASAYFRQNNCRFGNYSQNNSHLLSASQTIEAEKLKNLPITITLNMTRVIDSVDGFADEYNRLCKMLSITSEIDIAIDYYNEWRSFRLEPFLD